MAIFNPQGPDQDLPALTQFYQLAIGQRDEGETDLAYGRRLLDTFAGEELRLWATQVIGIDAEMGIPTLTVQTFWEMQLNPGSTLTFPVSRELETVEAYLVWLADLHPFLRRLMFLAATKGVPTEEEVAHLNNLLGQYAPPVIFWEAPQEESESPVIGEELGTESRVPLLGMVDSPMRKTGRILIRQLYRGLMGSYFELCQSCQSAYLRTAGKQKYCSRRCSERESKREQRRRKKESAL